MIEKIVNRLIDKQLDNGMIGADDACVYRYGYTLFFEMLINAVIGITIGVVSGELLTVLAFGLCFITLRTYSGGWHASKAWQCTLVSNGVILLTVVLMKFYSHILFLPWAHIIELFCAALIIILSPVDSENKRLDAAEKKKCHNKVVVIVCIELVLYFVLSIANITSIGGVIPLTHITMAIALLAQRLSEN